jgi:hypothetical protein
MCGDLREGQMTGEILGTGVLIRVDDFSYSARCSVGMKVKHKLLIHTNNHFFISQARRNHWDSFSNFI